MPPPPRDQLTPPSPPLPRYSSSHLRSLRSRRVTPLVIISMQSDMLKKTITPYDLRRYALDTGTCRMNLQGA